MKKNVSPERVQAFRSRCEDFFDLPREEIYIRLGDEAGTSASGVKKWFAPISSKNHRAIPWGIYRLWHLVIFNEDIQE